MKYRWLKEEKNCVELSQELGVQVQGITRGDIIIGFEDGVDEVGNPTQVPIIKQGIEIELGEETPEVLEGLDFAFSELKREGGRDFQTAVSRNLDLRAANPQKEAFKLSQLYGLTQEQLADYIQNQIDSITSLAEAKAVLTPLLQKMAALELWLAKQTRLDE